MSKPGPLAPSAALLCKLGSIIVHLEEMNSPDGRNVDKLAMDVLLADPDVKEWVKQMDAMALLPKKRRL